jgi:hypothetical protein
MRLLSIFGVIASTLALSPAAGAWSLVQVGPNERTLEIRYKSGACETTAVHNVQKSRTVSISVSYEREVLTGNETCPEILYVRSIKIRLFQPLAGRHVEGGERADVGNGPYVGRYPAVPRLTGLSPADAKSLLGGLKLRALVRAVGRTTGLARVVSQSPAPGVREPKNREVFIGIRV